MPGGGGINFPETKPGFSSPIQAGVARPARELLNCH